MAGRFAYAQEVAPAGEEMERIALLADRLSDQMYRVPDVFTNGEEWPGDWTGRAILALACLEKLPGASQNRDTKISAQLEQIVHALAGRLNEKGYLGGITCRHNEQQLAGHSWLLRGLVQYLQNRQTGEAVSFHPGHNGHGDEEAQQERIVQRELVRIVRELFFPIREDICVYRISTGEEGEYSGNIAAEDTRWSYSTDTGCVFISLDGLSAVYDWSLTAPADCFLPEEDSKEAFIREIRTLTDELAGRFLEEDVAGKKLQTHATLTALRGVLRFCAVLEKDPSADACGTGIGRLREKAETIFSCYVEEGMSAAYGNYNWFRRPEWTEPCAIIDSFMLAMQFYEITGKSDYLKLARRMKSAMYHAQRRNGGFGCDSCAGAMLEGDPALCPEDDGAQDTAAEQAYERDLYVKSYEAYWCCTMRGGEGLCSAVRYAWIYSSLPDVEMMTIPYETQGIWEAKICPPEGAYETAGNGKKTGEAVRPGRLRKIEQKEEAPGRTRFVIEGDACIPVMIRLSLPDGTRRICAFPGSGAGDFQTRMKDGWFDISFVLETGTAVMTVSADYEQVNEKCPGRYNTHGGQICLCADHILGIADDTGRMEPIDESFRREHDENVRYRIIIP